MKRTAMFTILLTMSLTISAAEDKPVILKGEVVDLHCHVAGKIGKPMTANGFVVEKNGMKLFKLVSLE